VPVGVDETALAPVPLDLFDRDQHLVVFGDGQCGKTNLLRLVARGLAARYSSEEVVFGVFDPRRGLADVVPEPYVGGYATNSKISGGLAAGIAGELAKRMPGEDGDAQAAGARFTGGRWFDGPRIVLLVDDYDVLTIAGQQPLTAFVPYLPSARDIGLHVVVARRVAGGSRALYEPFLQTVLESGCAGFVMTGDRTEGQLFPGVYAAHQSPGRGLWVRRGERVRRVQTALLPPPDGPVVG
jgi:S-DNA-T family DNA segregation ATPase FtsK/SpoIIIE